MSCIFRPRNDFDSEEEKQKLKPDIEADEGIDVVDGDGKCRATKKQKKIGPELWSDVAIEEVDKVPEDITGLKVYKVKLGSSKEKLSIMSAAKDGRPWKKDSQTEWKGFGKVRYSDCKGSYACSNPKCKFKNEFGVVNCTQFEKKSKSCEVCGIKGNHVPCFPR